MRSRTMATVLGSMALMLSLSHDHAHVFFQLRLTRRFIFHKGYGCPRLDSCYFLQESTRCLQDLATQCIILAGIFQEPCKNCFVLTSFFEDFEVCSKFFARFALSSRCFFIAQKASAIFLSFMFSSTKFS